MVAMVRNRLVYANSIKDVAEKSSAGVSIFRIILFELKSPINVILLGFICNYIVGISF
jgi:hypothetical protein